MCLEVLERGLKQMPRRVVWSNGSTARRDFLQPWGRLSRSNPGSIGALDQGAIRAVIGTTFGAIFADNAANNGLLLISLEPEPLATLMEAASKGALVTIDLEAQEIKVASLTVSFCIEPSLRRAIMLGLDRIGETLVLADQIRTFEAEYHASAPWLLDDQLK